MDGRVGDNFCRHIFSAANVLTPSCPVLSYSTLLFTVHVTWTVDRGQKIHCRLKTFSHGQWTGEEAPTGQSVHCRFKSRLSPQGPRAWLRARRVPSVAEPPITKIQIAACGAHPVVAGAMAPIASITPGPVHVSTVNTRPVT